MFGLRADGKKDENIKGQEKDEKIKGKESDAMIAMLSQHAPPVCMCGELMWVHITAHGQASWRYVRCHVDISWQAYLTLEASTTYTADMVMPPMPATEPGEEPPTSAGATSSTTP
eukprot:278615-Heterocapsa_arctica.AAC.1